MPQLIDSTTIEKESPVYGIVSKMEFYSNGELSAVAMYVIDEEFYIFMNMVHTVFETEFIAFDFDEETKAVILSFGEQKEYIDSTRDSSIMMGHIVMIYRHIQAIKPNNVPISDSLDEQSMINIVKCIYDVIIE